MISVIKCDDPLSFLTTILLTPLKRHFQSNFQSRRPIIRKETPWQSLIGEKPTKPLRQFTRLVIRKPKIRTMTQGGCLFLNHRNDSRMAVPVNICPNTRIRIQIATTFGINQPTSFSPNDHQGIRRLPLLLISKRMPCMGPIRPDPFFTAFLHHRDQAFYRF